MKKRLEGLYFKIGILFIIAPCLISCKEEESNQVSVKVTESNLCSEAAEVMCHNVFECCGYSTIEDLIGVENVNSKSACLRDVKLSCEETTSELQFALDKKRASVNTSAVEACLKSLVVGEAGCFPVLNEFATPCSKALISGKQGEGKECLNDFECTQDAYCGGDLKCHSLLAQGEACADGGGCKSGLYCTVADGDTTATCQPLKNAGEPCTASSQCGDGLYCDREIDQCAGYKAIGEPCDNTTPCESGNCLSGTCPNGNLCDDDYDCSSGYCAKSGSSCGSDADCGGTCAKSGYSCSASYPCSNACAYNGNTCYEDTDCYGVCTVNGGYCDDDSDCAEDEGEVCDRTGQCQPDSCVTDTCVGGGTCESRVCGPKFVYPDFCAIDIVDYVSEGNGSSTDADVAVSPF